MKDYRLICPRCRTQFTYSAPEVVDGVKEPQLKEKIFSGEFFVVTCPQCGSENAVLLPLLYHDSRKRFMIQLIDETDEDPFENALGEMQKADEIREHAIKNSWRLRIVRDPNELLEKILIFEDGMDDRAVELIKAQLKEDLSKQLGKDITGLFYSPSDSGACFVVETDEGFIGELPAERSALLQAAELFSAVPGKDAPENRRIDSEWAEEILRFLK